MEAFGDARLEYRPLPASPIAVALLFITLLVVAIGLPLSGLSRGSFDLWWLWVLPPGLIALGILLARPRPLRIYDRGLELPLPLWRRLLGQRGRLAFTEVRNLYPRLYYVAGALLSPFAASMGTVEHLGLTLETMDGRETLLRFTPSVPRFSRGEEVGYRLVVEELREIFRRLDRPWVTDVPAYAATELEMMKRAAARRLLPFPVITGAFFAPIALIPLLYFLLDTAGVGLSDALLLVLVVVGILPTLVMLLVAWGRSRTRRRTLKALSKHAEWERGRSTTGKATPRGPLPPPGREPDKG